MASELGSGSFHDLSVYQKNPGFGGIFPDIFESRPEQTLGGATIGLGRDALSAPESAEEKLERAQENDMASHIAADTIAILPTVRALPAGLARATMLVNPHQSVSENAGAFTLNVGEGMALNYVGKSMLPGSGLQKTLANNIASPFAKEIATHLSVGAGFGLVKGGFDTKNWADEQGNFTPGKLVTNVAKSTAAGALINVPAGMVGVRAMKGSMAVLAKSEAPQRVATTIAAAGSGYTSGTVFGGIDAISQGKSFSETLAAMHFAGKVGLVTGGVMGSIDNGALHSKQRALVESVLKAQTVPVQEKLPSTSGEKGAAKPAAREELPGKKLDRDRMAPEREPLINSEENVQDRSVRSRKYENLDYVPLNDYRLGDVTARLKNPRREVEVVYSLKPEAAGKKFNSREEFLANTELKEVNVRVYDIEGHKAKLVVEETLAAKMEKIKRPRLAIEKEAHKEIPFDKLPANQRYKISLDWQANDSETTLLKYFDPPVAKETASVLRARQAHLADRKVDPIIEDFVVLLDEMPSRSRVKRLVLSEEANPEDVWSKQKYDNPDFESAASASDDGTIKFYLTKNMLQDKATLRTFMGHEFGHLAAAATPEETGLYHLAIMVDKDVPNRNYDPGHTTGSAAAKAVKPQTTLEYPPAGADKPTDKHFVREYARTNADEDGAVNLGEEMLAPDADKLIALGQNAPVRTVLQARSLARVVSTGGAGDQSTHAQVIGERLRYVEHEVLPEAVKLLERRTKHGSASEQAASAELLGHIGEVDRHTAILRKLASNPEANVVPKDLPGLTRLGATEPLGTTNSGRKGLTFNRDGTGRTVADIAFDAMLKLHAGDVQKQFNFLVNEAHPNSPTRELALTRLASAKHDSAPHYLQLAKVTGNSEKLPELIDLMKRMPDTDGRIRAFNEAYNLGENSPDFRRSVLGRALEIPGVGGRAIELLRPDEVAMFEPQLFKLSKQVWDKRAQERSRQLLSELATGTDPGRVMALLRSDNPRGVQQGLQIVLASKSADNRLIEPLVEVAATAPEATSKAARQALMRFTPQLVKFHAQEQKRRGNIANPDVISDLIQRR